MSSSLQAALAAKATENTTVDVRFEPVPDSHLVRASQGAQIGKGPIEAGK